MRVLVLPFQDVSQLHFDCVAAAVSDSALTGRSHDQVILDLGCTLFDCADNVFPDVSGQPFIHSRNLASQALEFIDAHGTDFQKRTSHKVLDTLLGRCQFHPIGSGACSVLQGPFGHELEHRPSGPSDGGPHGRQYLVCLLHRGSRGDLVSSRGIYI